MKSSKRVYIYMHPSAIAFFKQTHIKINKWIQEQVPLYQGLPLKGVPNGNKQYLPSLTLETIELLDSIPGRTCSRKLNNLYWDYVARVEKRNARYRVLHKLFPKD